MAFDLGSQFAVTWAKPRSILYGKQILCLVDLGIAENSSSFSLVLSQLVVLLKVASLDNSDGWKILDELHSLKLLDKSLSFYLAVLFEESLILRVTTKFI